MALGGEVDDGIASAHRIQHAAVTDVQLHKLAPALLQRRFQVLQVTGVGELVEDHQLPFRMCGQRVMNEVGTDEPSTSRDQQLHRLRTVAGTFESLWHASSM